MSKKFLATTIAIIAVLALLIFTPAGDALLCLFLAGAIPGTTKNIPSGLILFTNTLLITGIISFLMLDYKRTSDHAKKTASQKKRLPRRRYSHI